MIPMRAPRWFIALCLALALPIAGAWAQTATQAAPKPLTMQEASGLGCLVGATVAAAGVYVYNDVLMVAVTGYINPVLLIPTMAAAFAAGCSIGTTITPGFMFLGSRLF